MRTTPLDFVAFHAKGRPVFVDGHVRMGIGGQLRTIDIAFARFASFPELKGKPIVIGESDPEGCAACQGPNFSYRNGTVYSSYTAASFARKHDLADKHGVNFAGALMSTAVAATVAKGIVDSNVVTLHIVLAGLLGAIFWNLITWYYGLPSSSSHALIGGYAGAAVTKAGFSAIIASRSAPAGTIGNTESSCSTRKSITTVPVCARASATAC